MNEYLRMLERSQIERVFDVFATRIQWGASQTGPIVRGVPYITIESAPTDGTHLRHIFKLFQGRSDRKLGGIGDKTRLSTRRVTSQAGHRWVGGFCRRLKSIGKTVIILIVSQKRETSQEDGILSEWIQPAE
jgi:hypothetical protein